jgi:hypothetical protein
VATLTRGESAIRRPDGSRTGDSRHQGRMLD